jgi:hypothetical protein
VLLPLPLAAVQSEIINAVFEQWDEAILLAVFEELVWFDVYDIRTYRAASLAENQKSDIPVYGEPPKQIHICRLIDLLVAWEQKLGPEKTHHIYRLDDQTVEESERAFANLVMLSGMAKRGELFTRDMNKHFEAFFELSPAEERPMRRVVFNLLQKLTPEHAVQLAATRPHYIELLSNPNSCKPDADAWVM